MTRPLIQIALTRSRVPAILPRLLTSALLAADPAQALRRVVRTRGAVLTIGRRRYDLRTFHRIIAVGGGKASGRLAAALEARLGRRLEGGLVVVKRGHGVPTRRIRLIEAGHPVPDRAGTRATDRLRALIAGLKECDLLFVLLSGGASSLLPAPAHGLALTDKQRTTRLLLRSGAPIHEVNVVRKHLSALKGGRLVEATQASVIGLILSDVFGDDPASIASGPTAPDSSTYAQACRIFRRHRLWPALPSRVRRHLETGLRGKRADTPKPGHPMFRRVHNVILGNNRLAVQALARRGKALGLHVIVATEPLLGEARVEGRRFGALARRIAATGTPIRRPALIVAGGEPTVTVRGPGTGGRAQEFALAAARGIAGLPKVWIAAIGTDGTDGPTEVAGAVVDGSTVDRARRIGVDLNRALRRNDSYDFFRQTGGHIVTGPTGTNVNDLYLILAL